MGLLLECLLPLRFTKQWDNVVWILTVTIHSPLKDMNSGNYTTVLAMGKSSEDHIMVIKYYYKDIRNLTKGVNSYFGATNEI